MTTYTTTCWGQSFTVSANWSQASSQVLFDGQYTQYQVADFQHSATSAMRRLLEAEVASSGLTPEDDSDIDTAIDEIQTLIESQIDDHSWDVEWTIDGRNIAVDGGKWFAWRDSDDELTEIELSDLIAEVADSDDAEDILRHAISESYSTLISNVDREAYWIDAAGQTWDLPCHLLRCGKHHVAMWSDTTEAGVDDIVIVEADGDEADQLIAFANGIAADLGTRCERTTGEHYTVHGVQFQHQAPGDYDRDGYRIIDTPVE